MRSQTQPRPDIPAWTHPLCACGKVLATDRADAKKWRRIYADHNGNHNEVRYYTCRYGTWHWTSRIEEKELAQP